MKILTIFGTRPEVIKLAPVIQQLESRSRCFRTVNVTSSQHMDLLYPFVQLFGLRIDHDLKLMEPGQTPTGVCARVLGALEPILSWEQPDLILVQGDTTTAMAGALSGFYQRIPVGHVEAGLRSGNSYNPYPEEMNRRLITRLATYHFAATVHNRDTLLSEGLAPENIVVTGNPVVDALYTMLERSIMTPAVNELLESTRGLKRIVLTTHRRESFGDVLERNLRVLRSFIDRHEDVALVFPVHPNPAVVAPTTALLSGHPRIYLIQPLNYQDFIGLLSHAWLLVSDSGGVQEEAPTLGKPLLILRENTERPEAVQAGVARLVGGDSAGLATMLEAVYGDDTWVRQMQSVENPFGRGDSGKRIVEAIGEFLSRPVN
jgi:UDP-N-acetylglucosamine 2-epimerase (non-hydrolysing)